MLISPRTWRQDRRLPYLPRCFAAPPPRRHLIPTSMIGNLWGSQFLGEEHQAGYRLRRARCYQHPRVSHGDATIHLVKYLKTTRTQGIALDPDGKKSFEVYADADFCGNWHHPTAGDEPSTTKSQTGYSIMYTGCPIIWCSKLQTQIALFTTEAGYITLPQSLQDMIPMMQLLIEIKSNGFYTHSTVPEFHCKASKDNSSALEIESTPKMRPRTMHTKKFIITFATSCEIERLKYLQVRLDAFRRSPP